ncbi:MAG: alpha-glucan family phosphorylase [Dehalococcoidia bacterium]
MHLRATQTLLVEPKLPAPVQGLRDLAYNLFWTWNTDTAALFERLDPALWHETRHNPVQLLQQIPFATLERAAEDGDFREHLNRAGAAFRSYLARPPHHTIEGVSPQEPVAYFSLEFALTESLPNYSGGLGVLAGDHLKAASDLGIPLVGVGLLYHEGYFRQSLGADGWQREEYQLIDVAQQPLCPVFDESGNRLSITVPVNGRTASVQVWRLDVGKVPLFLLDTDNDKNSETDRQLTGRLYGGDSELRIQQEMVLGIGGVRALRAMGLNPAVCHMNEGHSSLLGLERIRSLMEEQGASFAQAMLPVTAATTFTTHTAVAAGIDLFPPDLVRRHLGDFGRSMGLDENTLLGLGRVNPLDESEPFSMAMLGLRLSGFRNGVSKLHGTVSQRLWDAAWPALPLEQVPIDSVTNGVHLTTWVANDIGEIYDRYIGHSWRDDPSNANWAGVADIPDEELWTTHERQRARLIHRARTQHAETLMSRGLSETTGAVSAKLDPNALTIGFARRFAAYKRATLLFRNPERLAAILNRSDRPVQFIFAGKAHPRDEGAKALIREVMQLSAKPEFQGRLVLLERYDVELARALVQGCDIWLNTPVRPLEASGTSGMKACANSAIHMSVMDGWWWEAYRPGLGWKVGRSQLDDDPEAQDAFDSESIYDLLEHEVTNAFYNRDSVGVPREWVGRMKASIAAFAPVFNTSRMVTEYATKAYAPAAASWHALTADGLSGAREQAKWLESARAAWSGLKVHDVSHTVGEDGSLQIRVQLHPAGLSAADFCVEAVYGASQEDGQLTQEGIARLLLTETSPEGELLYSGSAPIVSGGRKGYTIRILPSHPHLHDPLSTGLVLWA